MFTGIIEEIGSIANIKHQGQTLAITVKAKLILQDIKLGDSIAINGVCLTVTSFDSYSFSIEVMPETYKATNLSELTVNSKINLERAMAVKGRFGGHIVSGHVDGIGKILTITKQQNALIYTICIPEQLICYCLLKGSIAIDGTSLTIFEIKDNTIKLSLIPHTQVFSIIGSKQVGESVNVECDMIIKQVTQYLQQISPYPTTSISKSMLLEHGFLGDNNNV